MSWIRNCFGNLSIMLILIYFIKIFENLSNFLNILLRYPTMSLKYRVILFQHIHCIINRFFLNQSHFQLLYQTIFNSLSSWICIILHNCHNMSSCLINELKSINNHKLNKKFFIKNIMKNHIKVFLKKFIIIFFFFKFFKKNLFTCLLSFDYSSS